MQTRKTLSKKSIALIIGLIISFLFIFHLSSAAHAAGDYKWNDINHDSLTDPNGTIYESIGYTCSTVLLNKDYQLDPKSYPQGHDKDKATSYNRMGPSAFSGRSTVPTCSPGDYTANYIWIAKDRQSYIIVSKGGDNKLESIHSQITKASLWQIGQFQDWNNPQTYAVSFNHDISNIAEAPVKAGESNQATTPQTTAAVEQGKSDVNNNEANCDDALSPMGWVLCPIMNFADNMYDWFKTLANELLFFETDKYQPGQKSEGLYNSWKTMVKIANTILVLVGVVIIAGQIFSFEFISAYTVKKALPRLVIAAILIQLSWIMVTTGVQIVNAIGAGLYWLLVAPFKIGSDGGNILEIGSIIGSSSANQGGGVANGVGFGVVIAAMTGVVATSILTGAWVSIIMAAVGVLVSLAVAIVVLLLREATLIILIAISPIAIALWILPGTEGIWKLWWKTFSRLLMMYPLIMLLFAGGTISAIILAQSSSYINLLFAIVVYFIPIFLISATYKFAGGAFASMASFTEKIGGKVKSGGMLGLRDRAKFQKENSSWNLAKKSREADRQRNSQTKYADKLTGTGRYSKFLQQRSGIGDVGRQRAMAGAAATITAEKQQAFKNDQALAEFQIQKLAAGASEWQLDDDGKVQLDDGGNKISASLYDKQRQTRAAIMGAETGGIASINGQDVNITQALQNHTALQSLQNKDGSKGLLDYVDSSHASLSDLATENSEAYSTLIKHAPAIAKSDGPSVKTPGNRSYQQALENFSEISHIQWKRDTVGALQQQLATNPDQAVANLSQMARNPAIKTNDLAMISKAVGFDLSDLRNNENAVLRYDPPAPLPAGVSGPLPLGKLRM